MLYPGLVLMSLSIQHIMWSTSFVQHDGDLYARVLILKCYGPMPFWLEPLLEFFDGEDERIGNVRAVPQRL
jgi:hypothetical protein